MPAASLPPLPMPELGKAMGRQLCSQGPALSPSAPALWLEQLTPNSMWQNSVFLPPCTSLYFPIHTFYAVAVLSLVALWGFAVSL